MKLTDPGFDPQALIAALGLQPHPEGGHFREVFRTEASTAIHYLLRAGERSHWHRVLNADEGWHWYGGGALVLRLSETGTGVRQLMLGPDLGAGECPFAIVPRGCWQAAAPRDGWVLCGCTVAPAFSFDAFEMAPPGWEPASDDRSAEGREGLNRRRST